MTMRSWGDHLDAVAKPILNLQHMHYGKGMLVVEFWLAEFHVFCFNPAVVRCLTSITFCISVAWSGKSIKFPWPGGQNYLPCESCHKNFKQIDYSSPNKKKLN